MITHPVRNETARLLLHVYHAVKVSFLLGHMYICGPAANRTCKAAAQTGYNNRFAAFEYHRYENLMNVYGVEPVHR